MKTIKQNILAGKMIQYFDEDDGVTLKCTVRPSKKTPNAWVFEFPDGKISKPFSQDEMIAKLTSLE